MMMMMTYIFVPAQLIVGQDTNWCHRLFDRLTPTGFQIFALVFFSSFINLLIFILMSCD